MKRITFIIFLFFIIVSVSIAQPKQSGINYNSTYTALDSAGTWTGTKEYLSKDYSWVCVTVSSDQSGTGKIAFSRDGTTFNSYYFFSYTAGDTSNNRFYAPVTMDWVRVSYANDTIAQTSFSLTTSYLLSSPMPLDSTGALKVAGKINVNGSTADSLNLAAIKTLLDKVVSSSNSYGTSFTTTGTTIDSVSFGFVPRVITIIFDGISTDTLFVSPVSTFPTTNRYKRLGGEGLTKQWAVPKIYIKVGTTPLASKKIRVEAN